MPPVDTAAQPRADLARPLPEALPAPVDEAGQDVGGEHGVTVADSPGPGVLQGPGVFQGPGVHQGSVVLEGGGAGRGTS